MASNDQAPSILSRTIKVSGQIYSEGDIQIDGEIHGDIVSSAITIGEYGVIHGGLVADIVTIRGRVSGSIHSRQVHLCATAQIEGDVYHTALAIEEGAKFNGQAHCVEDPLSEASVPQLKIPELELPDEVAHLKSA